MLQVWNHLIAGTYRATRRIAEGGIGEVWLGIDVRSGERVALKRLLPEAASNRELAARFEREARLLDRVRSDFVARRLDFVRDRRLGRILVQQFIPGPPLSRVLDQRRLSPEQARELAFHLLLGLIALERARIVHGDYKPSNIILAPRPVLIDFGASRLIDLHPRDLDGRPGQADRALGTVSDHLVVGTLEYMAPEQFSHPEELSCAADLYALGAILYRALRGEHVFCDRQGAQLVQAKLTLEAPRLELGRADPAARRLEQVVACALQRDRGERYRHAEDMLADLMAAGTTTITGAPPPRRPTPPPLPDQALVADSQLLPSTRTVSSRRASRATAAVLALALFAAGAVASGLSPRPQAAAPAGPSPPTACLCVASGPAADDREAAVCSEPYSHTAELAASASLPEPLLRPPEAPVQLARTLPRRSGAAVAQIDDPETPRQPTSIH